jgi:hypothetical protein
MLRTVLLRGEALRRANTINITSDWEQASRRVYGKQLDYGPYRISKLQSIHGIRMVSLELACLTHPGYLLFDLILIATSAATVSHPSLEMVQPRDHSNTMELLRSASVINPREAVRFFRPQKDVADF